MELCMGEKTQQIILRKHVFFAIPLKGGFRHGGTLGMVGN